MWLRVATRRTSIVLRAVLTVPVSQWVVDRLFEARDPEQSTPSPGPACADPSRAVVSWTRAAAGEQRASARPYPSLTMCSSPRMPPQLWSMLLFVMSLTAAACNSPTGPSADSLTIRLSQASGSILTVPPQYPYNAIGGVLLPFGSGVLSVSVAMTVGHNVPRAQLNVYLLTGGAADQYCGQNLPDSPAWQFLTPGWKQTVTVTGFQVYRLPCDVTGIRAMLHQRNNGLLTPPTASETIVENTLATSWHLVR